MTDKLTQATQAVERTMSTVETVLQVIVTRLGLWLAPLPSAILVARASARVFALDAWLALVMAVTVEVVGLVTSERWLAAKDWNQRRDQRRDTPADERLALALMGAYFMVTFAMLLAAELPTVLSTGNLVGLTALLFPGLSAVAIVSMNERIIQYRREAARETRLEHQRASRQAGKQAAQSKRRKASHRGKANRQGNDTRQGVLAIYAQDPRATQAQAAQALGVSRQAVGQQLAKLEAEGIIERNGQGVKVL